MITASLALVDYLNIGADIIELDKGNIDLFHIDIMDGHLVPNLCLNFDIIKSVKEVSATPMDFHLMVENPYCYLNSLKEVQAYAACTHFKAIDDMNFFLDELKSNNIKAGIAINPDEDIDLLESYLEKLDYVLVMSVFPGFSGQKFLDYTIEKIKKLEKIRAEKNLDFLIEVDGGLDFENTKLCKEADADIYVAGAFTIFNRQDSISNLLRKYREVIK